METFLDMVADEYEFVLNEWNRLQDEVIKLKTQVQYYQQVEKTLQDTTIHLGGEKILSLLKGLTAEEQGFNSASSRSDLREYLDDELYLAVEEIVTSSEQELITKLHLIDDETEYLNGIFPRELKYPIDPQEDIKNRFTDFIRKKRLVPNKKVLHAGANSSRSNSV